MKMRRVLVQIEIETNAPIAALKRATLTVHEGSPTLKYLEANRVNVIRESKKKRGKRK